jgi:hypothetical protein
MKKIPCLFERDFSDRKKPILLKTITPGCEWALDGEGTASQKFDGSAAAVIDGKLYKRYDVKKGKAQPTSGIPCQEPDPVTGHWPHWVPVDFNNPADKFFVEGYNRLRGDDEGMVLDGTYELVGPRVNGNPEKLEDHMLMPHGCIELNPPRTFDGLMGYLNGLNIEGIVFKHPDGRMCKIRRDDFGFVWPIR